jgi:L-asparagine oxygenase
MSISCQVEKTGWVFLPKLKPSMPHADIVDELGRAVCLGEGDAVHYLTPTVREDAPDNTFSGNYGTGAFPFHTDLAILKSPPRYLFLRCEVGSEDVGTLLIEGFPVESKSERSLLDRSSVRPRRRTREGRPLLKLVEQVRGTRRIRWDPLYLEPAGPSAKKLVTELRSRLKAADPTRIVLVEPGDTLIVDNWRMLHAREPAGENLGRCIARSYLEDLW